MASGIVFDPSRMTAAHRSLPLGTCVRVTRADNQHVVVVPVLDRGPYVAGRLIDLSEAAAIALDMKDVGLARVQIDVVANCDSVGQSRMATGS
jgi:rare lipoprotein A